MTTILLNRIKESSSSRSLDLSKLSKKHKVVVCEYNLDKENNGNSELDLTAIISKIKDNIRRLSSDDEVIAVANIYDVVLPLDFFIDKIDFSIFEDDNYGAIYTDYYSNGDVKHQKSHPRKSSIIPLVFFSAKDFLAFDNNNIYNNILSKKVSHHLAIPLCEVAFDREQD